MKDKLLKLHDYLLSNGYIKDADSSSDTSQGINISPLISNDSG